MAAILNEQTMYFTLLKVLVFISSPGNIIQTAHSVEDMRHFPDLPRSLFGTKNSYLGSFSEHGSLPGDGEWLTSPRVPSFCQPKHVNMLLRHGTRSSNKKAITRSTKIINDIRDLIDAAKFPKIKDWKCPFSLNETKFLIQSGHNEMMNIGDRVAMKYANLFQSVDKIDFISTDLQRTLASASAFMKGFGRNMKKNLSDVDVKVENHPIRFYDNCEKFIVTVEENKTALPHLSFGKSREISEVAGKISQRLGLKDNLMPDDVRVLYSVAGHEVAAFGESVWTEIFSLDDLLLLEYAAELKNYWRKGPGYNINHEQACPLLQEMFSEMDAVVEAQGNERDGVFRFGHAETLMPMLTLLGLYIDKVAPTVHNFHTQHNRQFRASRISPFAGNMAFVLYECDTEKAEASESPPPPAGSNWPPVFEKYMLQLNVKEQVEHFPFCSYDFCSYADVKRRLDRFITHCDYHDICRLEKNERDEL